MQNPTEQDERIYLSSMISLLLSALGVLERAVSDHSQKIIETKQYMWENAAQLDSAERALNRMIAYDETSLGEQAVKSREQIKRLLESPYFGRIDFLAEDEMVEQAIYIGIHAFFGADNTNLIYDWRAPISSMFYDFEKGFAHYVAPIGKISGEILLKRQYKIKKDHLEFMIESGLNIQDEILQKELSQNSDEKMKTIVATIQREQNAIIRNETTKVLILQGAAGSGKTSIALHRIAFLLYRFKDILKSENIMILSPNKVFGNYISNVLPELGEENVSETRFEDLAAAILGPRVKFQTFAEQIEEILNRESESFVKQIEYKATNDFVTALDDYLRVVQLQSFHVADLDIGKLHVDKTYILSRYLGLKKFPIRQRLEKIAVEILFKAKNSPIRLLEPKDAKEVKQALFRMFDFSDALSLYHNFYRHINRPDLFVEKKGRRLDYSDVFPYLYVKLFFEQAPEHYQNVKHLLVDEMQDYTPIQYAVLSKLFSCKMTILGDCNQSVNPYSSSSAGKISPYFQNCACMELTKSYRSTLEIMQLAQTIQRNEALIPMERHGETPCLYPCASFDEEVARIIGLIATFERAGFRSLAILCKSRQQAASLYQACSAKRNDISLLDFESTVFKEGIVLTTVHMSKGLEFDQVILSNVSRLNYATKLEKGLLYIACTRAMHKLDFTCVGEMSEFLQHAAEENKLTIK